MALDVDRLRSGLEEYRKSLERQQSQLANDFRELESLFAALFAAYGGRMAKELHHDWSRTAQWFEMYLHATKNLGQHLVERTDELKHL